MLSQIYVNADVNSGLCCCMVSSGHNELIIIWLADIHAAHELCDFLLDLACTDLFEKNRHVSSLIITLKNHLFFIHSILFISLSAKSVLIAFKLLYNSVTLKSTIYSHLNQMNAYSYCKMNCCIHLIFAYGLLKIQLPDLPDFDVIVLVCYLHKHSLFV